MAMDFRTSLEDFLHTVVTTTDVIEASHIPMYMHVYSRISKHHWLKWPPTPDSITQMQHIIDSDECDIYFSPHLSPEPHTDLPDAPVWDDVNPLIPTRTLAVDIDYADLMYLPLLQTALVKTSAARHQVYYVFESEVNETLSKQLTMSIEGADHLSHRLGHMFRLPTTYNHKYATAQPIVIVQNTRTIHKIEDLMPSPNGHNPYTSSGIETLLTSPMTPPDLKPYAYLDDLNLSPSASMQYSTEGPDPQDAIHKFIIEMLHKKVPVNNAYHMAKTSANNYFKKLKYNQDYELAKYVLKLAQIASRPDSIAMVRRVRTAATTFEERHEMMFDIVRECMMATGKFYNTKQGGQWFVPDASTSSIQISKNSEGLQHYLNRVFTLNAVDIDTQATIASLCAFCTGLPQRVVETKLALYSKATNRMLVHTGAGTVFSITPNHIEAVHNGDYGALFQPLSGIFIPFMPHNGPLTVTKLVPDPNNPNIKSVYTENYTTWNEALFGPFLDNIMGLEHDEAKAILSAWFLFLFFKSAAPSRPLLAIFGQPGAGKSTVLKRVSHFLYGKLSGIVGVTTPQEYDHNAFVFPLLVFDNVDTWEKWLPDRLAQSAGQIDTGKRKQYTDDQTIILTKDAMVALTAHDPKFSRPDIADRLLILRKVRFDRFEDEAELMQLPRAAMWYNMLHDISIILGTPRPNIPEQLRVQDFASTGSWIASGLGLLPDFQSALVKIRSSQRGFALDNDQVLLDALISYALRSKSPTLFKAPSQLYSELELMYSLEGDAHQFTKKYRSPTQLSNKLFAAQDALGKNLDIATDTDDFGRRVWRIMKKETTDV